MAERACALVREPAGKRSLIRQFFGMTLVGSALSDALGQHTRGALQVFSDQSQRFAPPAERSKSRLLRKWLEGHVAEAKRISDH